MLLRGFFTASPNYLSVSLATNFFLCDSGIYHAAVQTVHPSLLLSPPSSFSNMRYHIQRFSSHILVFSYLHMSKSRHLSVMFGLNVRSYQTRLHESDLAASVKQDYKTKFRHSICLINVYTTWMPENKNSYRGRYIGKRKPCVCQEVSSRETHGILIDKIIRCSLPST